MSNIFHQSVEDILKAATPEQRLLWNYIFLRWGERVPISQVYYQGAFTGTEFLTYSANKLYIIYSALISGYSAGTVATPPTITIYDELNAAFGYFNRAAPIWDATAAAARSYGQTIVLQNIYFSRLILGTVSTGRIIGYRIAI